MTDEPNPVAQFPTLTPREAEIRRLVAEAPPLTAEQRDRIRRILAPMLDRMNGTRKKTA